MLLGRRDAAEERVMATEELAAWASDLAAGEPVHFAATRRTAHPRSRRWPIAG